MQKARIVSTSLDDANLFAEQLRAEKFAVEVTQPGESPLDEVDLEIMLEHCSQESALDRAAEIANRTHADIYVEPGAFDKVPPKKANDVPLLQPSVVDTINGIAAGLQNKRDLMAKALREQRALARQNRLTPRTQMESDTPLWRLPDADTEPAWRKQGVQPKLEEETSVRKKAGHVSSKRNQPEPAPEMEDGQRTRITSSRTREMRAAFAIAALCSVIMTILWAAALRMPRSPLSGASGLKGVEQRVPFEEATSKPAQTSLAQEPDHSSQSLVTSSQFPSPVTRKVRKPEAALVSHRTPANKGDEIIAEDQVVYIGSRGTQKTQSRPSRPSAPQNASLRRYSDIK